MYIMSSFFVSQIAEISFWAELAAKSRVENESEHSELPPLSDAETNVYSFGVLLLEIISGKLHYSKERGPLVNWVHFKSNISHIPFLVFV